MKTKIAPVISPAIVDYPIQDDVLQNLEKARELLSDIDHWCQGVAYKFGEPMQFCAIGALIWVANGGNGFGPWRYLELPAPYNAVATFNDALPHTPEGHAQLLAMFDAGIARRRKEIAEGKE